MRTTKWNSPGLTERQENDSKNGLSFRREPWRGWRGRGGCGVDAGWPEVPSVAVAGWWSWPEAPSVAVTLLPGSGAHAGTAGHGRWSLSRSRCFCEIGGLGKQNVPACSGRTSKVRALSGSGTWVWDRKSGSGTRSPSVSSGVAFGPKPLCHLRPVECASGKC